MIPFEDLIEYFSQAIDVSWLASWLRFDVEEEGLINQLQDAFATRRRLIVLLGEGPICKGDSIIVRNVNIVGGEKEEDDASKMELIQLSSNITHKF